MNKQQLLARCIDLIAGDRVHYLARWSGVLVFNYHRIGDPDASPFDRDTFSATVEGFDEQMQFLSRHFDVLGLEDLDGANTGRLRRGRHVLVTFDDGYRDNYDLALPILRARSVRAAFFVTSCFLDDGGISWWDEIAWMVRRGGARRISGAEWLPADLSTAEADRQATIQKLLWLYKQLPGSRTGDFIEWLAAETGSGRCPASEARGLWLTWDMVREMRAAGMAIGGHTVTHPVLARLAADEQAREILGSAKRIREELGEPMRWFSYPVGQQDSFNEATRRALAEAGVELAFSYYGGHNRAGQWDCHDVRRIAVHSGMDGAHFRTAAALPTLVASPDTHGLGRRLRATVAELLAR